MDYLRVQVLLSFFGRLTDLEMLYHIVDEILSPDERTEVNVVNFKSVLILMFSFSILLTL